MTHGIAFINKMNVELEKLPDYTPNDVVDEMKYYLKKSRGNSAVCTFENLLVLVNLAKVNNRITKEQAYNIKKILNEIKNN